jgi:16S rRNA (adenine1518-N6/adenine1519-N6)-dimethyltransferase
LGRRFGQHFLTRKSTLEKIAEAACGERTSLVIEIGAGKGSLTEALLDRADKVVAIEVDPVLVHYLQQKFREPIDSGRLVLVESDVLKADLGAWGRCVIAGNLPYYITSPILDRVFAAASLWERAVFLVQAEVAARLAAIPGSRDYGYLTVFAQVQAQVEMLFEVPRTAFRPPPKVDSAIVKLEPREAPADLRSFVSFAGMCFRQKRKTLRNNLAPYYGKAALDALPEAKLRAEQMSIADLVKLRAKLRQDAVSVEPA